MTAALATTMINGARYALPHVGRGLVCAALGCGLGKIGPYNQGVRFCSIKAEDLVIFFIGEGRISHFLEAVADRALLCGPAAGIMTLAARNISQLSCLAMTPKATAIAIAVVSVADY